MPPTAYSPRFYWPARRALLLESILSSEQFTMYELSKDALEGVVGGAPQGGQGVEQPLPGPPLSIAVAPTPALLLRSHPIAERLPRLPRPPWV